MIMTYIPGKHAPRNWKHLNLADAALAAVILAGIGFVAMRSGASAGSRVTYWDTVLKYIAFSDENGLHPGLLLKGLAMSLRVALWSMILALVSGSAVGVLSADKRGLASLPFTLYVRILRNTPPLVLLFLVFFFSGSVLSTPMQIIERTVSSWPGTARFLFALFAAPEGQLDRMAAAVLTMGLYEGAFVAEIVRAGIESVPKGQWDAAAAQGLTPFQQRRYIIMPQAARLMLPPMTGQAVSTFKESSLASVISLPELTFQSLEIMAVTRVTFELWISAAIIYLVVSRMMTALGAHLEKRLSWEG
ncbi:MAG: amino acid ABC transporter permease [Mailhella sp.]|nr:amino acid ABC transporter permease [Mailhella sp.]